LSSYPSWVLLNWRMVHCYWNSAQRNYIFVLHWICWGSKRPESDILWAKKKACQSLSRKIFMKDWI